MLTTENIDNLWIVLMILTNQIFCSKVSHLESGRSEQQLLRAIEEDAFSLLSELGAPPPRRIQQINLKTILAQLESMKNYIDAAVDTRLDFYIEVRHNLYRIIHIYEYHEVINNEEYICR